MVLGKQNIHMLKKKKNLKPSSHSALKSTPNEQGIQMKGLKPQN